MWRGSTVRGRVGRMHGVSGAAGGLPCGHGGPRRQGLPCGHEGGHADRESAVWTRAATQTGVYRVDTGATQTGVCRVDTGSHADRVGRVDGS